MTLRDIPHGDITEGRRETRTPDPRSGGGLIFRRRSVEAVVVSAYICGESVKNILADAAICTEKMYRILSEFGIPLRQRHLRRRLRVGMTDQPTIIRARDAEGCG